MPSGFTLNSQYLFVCLSYHFKTCLSYYSAHRLYKWYNITLSPVLGMIQDRSLVHMLIHRWSFSWLFLTSRHGWIINLILMIVFCSPEELLVDEVLKTLVVSPNHPNRKKFKVTVVRNAVSLFSSFSTNVNTCSQYISEHPWSKSSGVGH